MNAKDGNSRRKWNQIAKEDRVTNSVGLWSLTEGDDQINFQSQCISKKDCYQSCSTLATLYHAIDGVAPDELTAERNAAYL